MPGDLSPTTDVLDDALFDQTVEAILRGRQPEVDGFDVLVEFASDVTALSDRPAPRPNASLAAVLASGFSTDKGDLLVTAGSNVNGPAPQAAGLPKWRNRHSMLPVPFLSGLVTKIVAGVVAGLAGVTAAGAAGALPGPAQDAVATVINTVTPFNLPTDDTSMSLGAEVTTSPSLGVDLSTGGNTTTTAGASGGAGTEGANASVTAGTPAGGGSAGGTAALTTPSIPGLPNLPGLGSLPGLPNLSNLPVNVPACVKDIVDLETGQPKVPLSQISTQVVNCVKSLLSTSGAQLPAGVDQCITSILGMAGNVTPGSVPNVTGFDWSTCVPFDMTECMTSMMNMFKGFVPGAGGSGLPGMNFLSGFDFEGCVPFNLDACLSSILGMAGNLPGVGTGGIPGLGAGTIPSVGDLDLSACVPFGSFGSIPGLGALSSFLPR